MNNTFNQYIIEFKDGSTVTISKKLKVFCISEITPFLAFMNLFNEDIEDEKTSKAEMPIREDNSPDIEKLIQKNGEEFQETLNNHLSKFYFDKWLNFIIYHPQEELCSDDCTCFKETIPFWSRTEGEEIQENRRKLSVEINERASCLMICQQLLLTTDENWKNDSGEGRQDEKVSKKVLDSDAREKKFFKLELQNMDMLKVIEENISALEDCKLSQINFFDEDVIKLLNEIKTDQANLMDAKTIAFKIRNEFEHLCGLWNCLNREIFGVRQSFLIGNNSIKHELETLLKFQQSLEMSKSEGIDLKDCEVYGSYDCKNIISFFIEILKKIMQISNKQVLKMRSEAYAGENFLEEFDKNHKVVFGRMERMTKQISRLDTLVKTYQQNLYEHMLLVEVFSRDKY